MTTETATDMGVHAMPPQQLPFGETLYARSFLLPREAGNILIYSTEETNGAAAEVAELGGVSRFYLGHGHEAMFPAVRVDAPLFVHQGDRAAAEKAFDVRGTFDRRHTLDHDFEVIPIPGHTPGSTAYLWDSGEHRLLFTGDTIYLDGGEWVTAVLGSSDREGYIRSLEVLREVEFDVLVPWAATGEPFDVLSDPAEGRQRIEGLIERVRSGADR